MLDGSSLRQVCGRSRFLMQTVTPLPKDSHWLDALKGFEKWLVGALLFLSIAGLLAMIYPGAFLTRLVMLYVLPLISCSVLLISVLLAARARFYNLQPSDEKHQFFYLNSEGRLVDARPGLYWRNEASRLMALSREMVFTERVTSVNGVIHFTFKIELTSGVTREAAVAFYNWYRDLRRSRANHAEMDQFLEASYARTDLPFKVSAIVAPATT